MMFKIYIIYWHVHHYYYASFITQSTEQLCIPKQNNQTNIVKFTSILIYAFKEKLRFVTISKHFAWKGWNISGLK